MGGTAARRLVEGRRAGDSQSAGSWKTARRADRMHRILRADAWSRDAGRFRRSRPSSADLVRRAHRQAMPGAEPKNRVRPAYPTHLQSCSAEFHTDQVFVDAGKRAAELEPRPLSDAAKRLCTIQVDGGSRHRYG